MANSTTLDSTVLSADQASVLHACLLYHRIWLSGFAAQASRSSSSKSFSQLIRRCEALLTRCQVGETPLESDVLYQVVSIKRHGRDLQLAQVACANYLENIELLAYLGETEVPDPNAPSEVMDDLQSLIRSLRDLQARMSSQNIIQIE
jgi:hypothetical protein